MYIRLCKSLNDYGILIKEETLWDHILDNNKEWYSSIYHYNEEQYEHFKTVGSVAGITDVTTNRIAFDFDSRTNVELARQDALVALERLEAEGVPPAYAEITFSGSKGFGISVTCNQTITPSQLKDFCFRKIGAGLETVDPTLYSANRIWRITGTKHPKTGLFKIPLTLDQLKTLTISEIKEMAKSLDNVRVEDFNYSTVTLPSDFFKIEEKKSVEITLESGELDFSKKPKFLTNCRWALQNGFFKEGERSTALLCLASTYKNLGFEKEHTYRLLKGVSELQSTRNEMDRFPDSEIWNNIITQVYSLTWNNGQYSCKNKDSWLHDYCGKLGIHKCAHSVTAAITSTNEVFDLFKNYTENYDKNVLTTGIKSLDTRSKFMVGTSNVWVAPPGVGKSSFALQLLNHNSNQNNRSVFFSYDMFHSALYMRMLQRHVGYTQEDIFRTYHKNPSKFEAWRDTINKEYKNVNFCFKSGQTLEDLEETVKDAEQNTGDKVRLAIIDYNELVMTGISDPTQSSSVVAQKVRQLANELEVCFIMLVQPSKLYSSPADEITSYNSAKGSSAIAQAQTLMFGFSRPGFNPRNPDTDRFFNITCLKNRNGPLFSIDLGWDGLRGSLSELADHEIQELEEIREAREAMRREDSSW